MAQEGGGESVQFGGRSTRVVSKVARVGGIISVDAASGTLIFLPCLKASLHFSVK